MFETGFPKHWSTLKKLIWLKALGIIGSSYTSNIVGIGKVGYMKI